jgi:gamma-glutamyltranspeptidase / glutathione hydrolase
MTLADPAEHEPEWVSPLAIDFQGVRIRELPQNGEGLAALITLGILDAVTSVALTRTRPSSSTSRSRRPARHSRRGRSYRRPLPDAVRAETLLADGYLCERAGLIRRDRAQAPDGPGQITPGPDGLSRRRRRREDDGLLHPVELSRLRLGNRRPGNRRRAQQPRCLLQPRSGHPNCVGPRKRPFNTIILDSRLSARHR